MHWPRHGPNSSPTEMPTSTATADSTQSPTQEPTSGPTPPTLGCTQYTQTTRLPRQVSLDCRQVPQLGTDKTAPKRVRGAQAHALKERVGLFLESEVVRAFF